MNFWTRGYVISKWSSFIEPVYMTPHNFVFAEPTDALVLNGAISPARTVLNRKLIFQKFSVSNDFALCFSERTPFFQHGLHISRELMVRQPSVPSVTRWRQSWQCDDKSRFLQTKTYKLINAGKEHPFQVQILYRCIWCFDTSFTT